MGLDLMGDRGIRSLLVFRRIVVMDEREGKETCLERQDSGLLAMNSSWLELLHPSMSFRPTRYDARRREAVLFHYTLDTMGSNGDGIRQAYGVWIQDS
jgi:hypothetical protein